MLDDAEFFSKREKKAARKCIFCNGGNLSHEHFWPNWADELLPGKGGNKIEETIVKTEKTKLVDRKKRERQGGVKGKTIRVVCESCNKGWMSRIEEAMKRVLTDLILGTSTTIPAAAQSALARWITLKVMVGEQNTPENAVFTQEQRDQFRILLAVPPQIKIWIADCGRGGWQTAYCRDSTILSLPEPEKFPTTLERDNVAVTTFGIGRLLVQARVSNAQGVDLDEMIKSGPALVRLWPPMRPQIVWPTEPRISADEAGRLAMILQFLMADEKVIWKPELPTAGG